MKGEDEMLVKDRSVHDPDWFGFEVKSHSIRKIKKHAV